MAKTYTKTQVDATEAMLLISKAERILANDSCIKRSLNLSAQVADLEVFSINDSSRIKGFGLIRERHFYDRVGGERRVRTADPIPPVLASVDQDFRRQRAGPHQ